MRQPMPSKTSKSITRYVSFRVNEGTIDRIFNIFHQYGQSVSIKMQLSDNSELRTDDIDDIKKFANTKNRRIISLEFNSSYKSDGPSIELSFKEYESVGACIDYKLSGENRDVVHISNEIETIITFSKPIYSFLVTRSHYAIGVEIGLKIILLPLIVASIILSKLFIEEAIIQNYITNIMIFIWGVWIFIIVYLPILRFFIPPASFEVGQGIARYEMKKFWRIGVLLSLIIGIIGSLLAVKLEWLVK
jgi:hypothetical protein